MVPEWFKRTRLLRQIAEEMTNIIEPKNALMIDLLLKDCSVQILHFLFPGGSAKSNGQANSGQF